MSWKWLVGGLILVFVLLSRGESSPPQTHRFTVSVQTPDGIRTGTSVVTFQYHNPPWWYPSAAGGMSVQGEAVVVRLGASSVLFLPSTPLYSEGISKPSALKTYDLFAFRDSRYLDNNGNIKFDRDFYPFLVYFKDFNDPNSWVQVRPNDFSSAFGPGYRLISIKSEVTTERPTFEKFREFPKLFEAHYGLRGRKQ